MCDKDNTAIFEWLSC